MQETRRIVERFYELFRKGDPVEIASVFSDPIDWHIPGNEAVGSWLGKRTRRGELVTFFRELASAIDPISADIRQILVDGETAIATGSFASRMHKTGKIYESIFFAHFTVRGSQIVRYRFLEDTWGLVRAMTD